MQRKCVLKVGDLQGTRFNYESNVTTPKALELVERPYKWNKKIVTWKIKHDSQWFPDTDKKFDFEWKAVRTAFRVWQNTVKDIIFKLERDPAVRADIEITFTKNDKLWADGKKGTLAYAYFPTVDNDQFTLAGDMVFNDWVEWTEDGRTYDKTNPDGSISKVRTYLLVHTLIHEIGHAIGLVHAESCQNCVMYPSYNGITALSPLDISRAQTFYGATTKSDKFVNYFKDRLAGGIIR